MADGKKRARKPVSRNPEETHARLVDAAEAEFNAVGFDGTDTNRIARRAGYAPQTFYRHFADKTAVFLAVYDRWWRAEADAVGKILRARGKSGLGGVADTLIAFHAKWRGFRRSLRHLSVEDARVRAARTVARRTQVQTVRALIPDPANRDGEIAAALLVLERLCDAAAEGEFADMGLPKAAAHQSVMRALVALYDGP
jgi:AcrR family transcriptional regulator